MLDNEDRPHVKPGKIKYTKGYTSKRIFSTIINSIIVLLIGLIVALAIFVYVKQPVKTDEGYIMAEPIYEMIEHGEKVIIINDDNFNIISPIKRFLITQETYPARIVAGPYGKVELMNGKYRVSHGDSIVSVNLDNPDEFLDMQYVARKLDNNGDPLQDELDLVITKDEVLGSIIE